MSHKLDASAKGPRSPHDTTQAEVSRLYWVCCVKANTPLAFSKKCSSFLILGVCKSKGRLVDVASLLSRLFTSTSYVEIDTGLSLPAAKGTAEKERARRVRLENPLASEYRPSKGPRGHAHWRKKYEVTAVAVWSESGSVLAPEKLKTKRHS